MIGRTVDREIERDLHAAARGFRRLSQSKSSSVPNDGSTSLCARRLSLANRIRHARLARLTRDRIVAAFAIRVTDRMDRRKINHVETHRLARRRPAAKQSRKCRAAITSALGRARKKFIPRSSARCDAIDHHARRRRILRRIATGRDKSPSTLRARRIGRCD